MFSSSLKLGFSGPFGNYYLFGLLPLSFGELSSALGFVDLCVSFVHPNDSVEYASAGKLA